MPDETPRSFFKFKTPRELRPGCEWVLEHLCEYYTWDMEPTELEAIHKHLHVCPGCAEEWRQTQSILVRIDSASPTAVKLKSVSSDEFLTGVVARIDRYESERARHTQPLGQRIRSMLNVLCPTIRIRRFATVLLLMISVSAMAYLSPMALRYIAGMTQGDSDARVVVKRDITPQPVLSALNGRGDHPLSGRPVVCGVNVNKPLRLSRPLIDTDLDGRVAAIMAEAEVEAMLPHSEAEWEAWARKEYPHIMWVYDVLTKPEYGINWDGKPAYIPDWAKKIWTDESTRPTGWRALVFYSGEIFKFDYPIKPEDPNVRPTIQAIKLGASVAGYELRLDGTGIIGLPKLKFADLDMKNRSNKTVFATLSRNKDKQDAHEETQIVPRIIHGESYASDYVDHIVSDRTMLQPILVYFAATSHCIPEPRWEHLEYMSKGMLTLTRSQKSGYMYCNMDEYQQKYVTIMVTYQNISKGGITVNVK